jgi:uncharacterized protein (TIGR02271 family)
MTEVTDAYAFEGRTMLDRDGDKIGKIDDVYEDRQSGRPEWALVNTGLFGTKKTFVPLHEAQPEGEDVRVPLEKARVKDAPSIEADGELSEGEERELFTHYGVAYSTDTGNGSADDSRSTDDAMTRSEEELRVGTERRETGRVRLRKFVVTENEQRTVPVSREEVRVEREPIDEGNAGQALDGPQISEDEHEVVLHEERPVVEKEVVPKERVRMSKEQHSGEETISEDVHKERIETDGEPRS